MSLILCFLHISMLLLPERFVLVSEEVLGWAFVAFFSLETLLSGVSSRGRLFCPPPTRCTLGCQKKLREEKDRWPLGLKSVLWCSKQRLRASAVLRESRRADAHTYGFPKWSCFYWGWRRTWSRTPEPWGQPALCAALDNTRWQRQEGHWLWLLSWSQKLTSERLRVPDWLLHNP